MPGTVIMLVIWTKFMQVNCKWVCKAGRRNECVVVEPGEGDGVVQGQDGGFGTVRCQASSTRGRKHHRQHRYVHFGFEKQPREC